MCNQLINREARLRMAAKKEGLTLQKATWKIKGIKYSGYQFAIGSNNTLIEGYAGYSRFLPYRFTLSEAELFVPQYQLECKFNPLLNMENREPYPF